MSLSYLACPYTHDDPLVRRARHLAANAAAIRLMTEQDEVVFSPITHCYPLQKQGDAGGRELPIGWDYWRRFDETFIRACYRMYVLPLDGWRESRGVQAEIDLAEELNLMITMLPEDYGGSITDWLVSQARAWPLRGEDWYDVVSQAAFTQQFGVLYTGEGLYLTPTDTILAQNASTLGGEGTATLIAVRAWNRRYEGHAIDPVIRSDKRAEHRVHRVGKGETE